MHTCLSTRIPELQKQAERSADDVLKLAILLNDTEAFFDRLEGVGAQGC